MDQLTETDVLIVGAGPTGLSLACQLIRYGIDFIIIDSKEGITNLSKAIAVQSRTLEIYEQIGLADKAIVGGTIAKGVNLITSGMLRGTLDLSNIGKDLSPFPFALLLEQSSNEQLLNEYLQENGKNVRWQTSLRHISQTSERISATVKNANGETRQMTAKYLVACDGAKSIVRHELSFSFEGSTINSLFYVADVEMEFPESHDYVSVAFGTDSFVAFFPLKGTNRWRIIGNIDENVERDESQIDYDEIEAKIKRETKLPIDITSLEWFSVYRVYSRRVDKFRDGRCFLAGDAAHIHTPAGGQGMNTGIGDAYNLAWKLALVLKGKADDLLLNTYNTERLENAKRLLETTDRLFELGTHDDFLTNFIRTYIFPFVAEYALKLDLVKQTVFPIISQIGINYRHSPLSVHEDDAHFNIKSGDRMPYFLIDGKSIYDFTREPKFHFLIFSNENEDFEEISRQLENYSEWINSKILPLSPQVEEIFGTDKPFAVLLRPDNHIAFISEQILLSELKNYPFLQYVFMQNQLS